MTRRRGPGARPPKPARKDDAELWRHVTTSVEPLKGLGTRGPATIPEVEEAAETVAPDRPKPRPSQRSVPRPAPSRLAAAPDLTGIDRRMRQKLSRGQVEVDSRIDLHGSSRAIARGRLLDFLVRARARGDRTVLVITGKGEAPFARHTLHGTAHFHVPERRGVLRQAVTEWFGEADFTGVVSGFQPSHPKHGGGGAFYVRLRRQKPQRRPT